METKAINTKLKGHARVDVADVLRGLAVMGIIILHSIEHFNFYSFSRYSRTKCVAELLGQSHLERVILHVRRKSIRHIRFTFRF